MSPAPLMNAAFQSPASQRGTDAANLRGNSSNSATGRGPRSFELGVTTGYLTYSKDDPRAHNGSNKNQNPLYDFGEEDDDNGCENIAGGAQLRQSSMKLDFDAGSSTTTLVRGARTSMTAAQMPNMYDLAVNAPAPSEPLADEVYDLGAAADENVAHVAANPRLSSLKKSAATKKKTTKKKKTTTKKAFQAIKKVEEETAPMEALYDLGASGNDDADADDAAERRSSATMYSLASEGVPQQPVADVNAAAERRSSATMYSLASEGGPQQPGAASEGVQGPTVLHLGDKVIVTGYDGDGTTGTVRFVGLHHEKKSPRVGIELSKPIGKSQGKFGGHKYFHCKSKHAVLVVPAKVSLAGEGRGGGGAADEATYYNGGAAASVGGEELAGFSSSVGDEDNDDDDGIDRSAYGIAAADDGIDRSAYGIAAVF